MDHRYRLGVIVVSTRPGRIGGKVAAWFLGHANRAEDFEVDVLDLAEIDLPFLDEPEHPSKRDYRHAHTWAWSERVEACDAFIVVTPEYNYGMPAPLKNALDFLYREWWYKPVGFVSYGGTSGGTRAVQMIKQVVTTLRMVPIGDTVAFNFVPTLIDEEGTFDPPDAADDAARSTLVELLQMTRCLMPMRSAPVAR